LYSAKAVACHRTPKKIVPDVGEATAEALVARVDSLSEELGEIESCRHSENRRAAATQAKSPKSPIQKRGPRSRRYRSKVRDITVI
jgi:hypothetical protein